MGALFEELDARAPASPDARMINLDFAPVAASRRSFTAWDMAALWIGLVVCVPTYTLVGSLIELGFNAAQGLAIILVRACDCSLHRDARATDP